MKKAEPMTFDDDGNLIEINPCADAANADWIRAARLQRRAEDGDEDAAAELAELENTLMYVDEGHETDTEE